MPGAFYIILYYIILFCFVLLGAVGNYKSDLFLWLFFYLLNLGPGGKPWDDTTLLKLRGAGKF